MTPEVPPIEPAELDLLAALINRDSPNRAALEVNAHVLAEDFACPINRAIYSARIACAADGESGEALLLDRLRTDGHLARDVDGRVGVRIAELLTRRVDVLQARALAVSLLDRAECRLIASHAAMADQVGLMPPDERRDAMRAYWRAYGSLCDRLDAAKGRIGEPVSRPDLKMVVSA